MENRPLPGKSEADRADRVTHLRVTRDAFNVCWWGACDRSGAVVSRFAPEHNDGQLAELAKHATVTQLSRSLASYWKGVKPAAPDVEPDKAEKDPEPEDTVHAFFDDDARYKIHDDLATERGAIVDKALEEARNALFQSGRKDVTWADALEKICLRSLGTITSATRSDRYRVVVHVDENGGWLNAGARLSGGVVKDIQSNPIIQSLFERGGRPVALGRSARVVPYRLAELILDRDDQVAGHASSVYASEPPAPSRQPRTGVMGECPGIHPALIRWSGCAASRVGGWR